ncbi:hypothetical protein KC19_7G125200 [Ceratodon purpureus]|uniref:Uncharacterized protein n=1 Tax=Ceratodon purpureus TaxID=3225 RepID=A0A8T0HAB0_CERPU|nr:hypothetical protein KC19_7G125200 [Ceratodon purpureus]
MVQIQPQPKPRARAPERHPLRLLHGVAVRRILHGRRPGALPPALAVGAPYRDAVHHRHRRAVVREHDAAHLPAPPRRVEAQHPIRVVPRNVLQHHALVVARLQHLVRHPLVHVAQYLRQRPRYQRRLLGRLQRHGVARIRHRLPPAIHRHHPHPHPHPHPPHPHPHQPPLPQRHPAQRRPRHRHSHRHSHNRTDNWL